MYMRLFLFRPAAEKIPEGLTGQNVDARGSQAGQVWFQCKQFFGINRNIYQWSTASPRIFSKLKTHIILESWYWKCASAYLIITGDSSCAYWPPPTNCGTWEAVWKDVWRDSGPHQLAPAFKPSSSKLPWACSPRKKSNWKLGSWTAGRRRATTIWKRSQEETDFESQEARSQAQRQHQRTISRKHSKFW